MARVGVTIHFSGIRDGGTREEFQDSRLPPSGTLIGGFVSLSGVLPPPCGNSTVSEAELGRRTSIAARSLDRCVTAPISNNSGLLGNLASSGDASWPMGDAG